MIGVEFYDERDNAYPFPGHDSKHTVKYGFTGALTKKCLDHGMLILNTGYLAPLSPLFCVCAVVCVCSCAVGRVRWWLTRIWCGVMHRAHETLRFIPPLTVSAEEIELGVELFEKGLKDTLKELAN
jgi:acetylornithine/succinyldiaminopimelate/putrescine aminotransferase